MKSIVISITLGTLAAVLVFGQTPRYTVTDLGVVGGPPGQPFNITPNGLISGGAVGSDGTMHAVLWFKGWRGDFGPALLGGKNSIDFGINEVGQAVGGAETTTQDPNGEDFCGFKQSGYPTGGTTCSPFLWQFGLTTPLPTLGGGSGVGNSINSKGQVVGTAETATPDPACPPPQKLQFKPVMWQNGKVQQLPTVSGDPEGVAFIINENGQAVGASGACATFSPQTLVSLQPLHALLWQNGTATDLGNLGGTGHALGNLALNLNNKGQVVGNSDLPGDMVAHAFLWTKETGMQDLGTLPGDIISAGLSISDAGVIGGVSLDADFNPRAFIRQNGVMTDLNSLVTGDSSLFLMVACSINPDGQIVGFAIDSNNEFHGYVATPANILTADQPPPTQSITPQRRILSAEARNKFRQLRIGIRLPSQQ